MSLQISTIYDLSDSLYRLLDPVGTFRLFQDHGIPSLSGNADRFILENEVANLTDTFVIETLAGSKALGWLGSLPPTRSISDKLFMCHGTPYQDDSYLLEDIRPDGMVVIKKAEVLEDQLNDISQAIVLCGHRHCPAVVSTRSKILINAGSVGVPAYSEVSPVRHRMETYNAMAR